MKICSLRAIEGMKPAMKTGRRLIFAILSNYRSSA